MKGTGKGKSIVKQESKRAKRSTEKKILIIDNTVNEKNRQKENGRKRTMKS